MECDICENYAERNDRSDSTSVTATDDEGFANRAVDRLLSVVMLGGKLQYAFEKSS